MTRQQVLAGYRPVPAWFTLPPNAKWLSRSKGPNRAQARKENALARFKGGSEKNANGYRWRESNQRIGNGLRTNWKRKRMGRS